MTIKGNQRDRIEIIRDILQKANGGIKKTHIMYKANLSSDQIKNYLSFLEMKGLLKLETKKDNLYKTTKNLYKTTDKGLKFLHYAEEVYSFIK